MYCSECGKQISNGSKFCSYCGAKLGAAITSDTSIVIPSSSMENRKLAENARKGTLLYLHDILSMEFSVNKLVKDLKMEKLRMHIHDYWFFWKEYTFKIPILQSDFRPFERMVLSYSYRLNKYYYALLDKYDRIEFFDYNGSEVNHQYGKPCCNSHELDQNTRKGFMTLPVIKTRLFSDPIVTNSESLAWGSWIIRDNGYRTEPFAQVKAIIEDFEHLVSKREQEYQTQLPALKIKIAELEKEIEDAKRILNNLYAVNIIPTKYRNMACAYFIYDFFSSSNTSLSNVFLHMDLDKIQSQLNTVIKNQQKSILQQAIIISQNEEIIAQNQQLLSELSDIHTNTSSINSQLNGIRESSIETEQWAKIAACNAEACAWIGLANYLK